MVIHKTDLWRAHQHSLSLLHCQAGPTTKRQDLARQLSGPQTSPPKVLLCLATSSLTIASRYHPNIPKHRRDASEFWHSYSYRITVSAISWIGLTLALFTVTPQCKCGPVTRPVAPTFPIIAPAVTLSPTATSVTDKCPYKE